MKSYARFLLILFAFPITSLAQDKPNLLDMLEKEEAAKPSTVYATATFKTTRLINAHSIEHVAGGVMDVKISHRFGEPSMAAFTNYSAWIMHPSELVRTMASRTG